MLGYDGRVRKSFLERRSKNEWFEKTTETTAGIKNDKKVPLNKGCLSQLLESILSYLKEYCDHSGLHGFSYLSEEHRSGIERLFWGTAIAVCAIACSLTILEMKEKLDTSNVVVTLAESPTSIWHIPFPAVTVCPVTKLQRSFFNFTDNLRKLTLDGELPETFLKWVSDYGSKLSRGHLPGGDSQSSRSTVSNDTGESDELFWKMWVLFSVCQAFDLPDWRTNCSSVLDERAMGFLLDVAPKMDTGLPVPNNYVEWRHTTGTFPSHFKHLWTEFGLCFTFNMMDNIYIYNNRIINNDIFQKRGLDKDFPKSSNDWNPDKGFMQIELKNTYPWRGPLESKYEELKLRLMENLKDGDDCWGKDLNGYKVILHHPQDHPQEYLNDVVSVPFGERSEIFIKVDVKITMPELDNYDPHKRQCYYSHERHLEYFKFYSQNNCELECLTNASLKLCGCVAFYMPRYNTTKICGRDANHCLADAAVQRKELDLQAALKHLSDSGESPFQGTISKTRCDCLPSCLSIAYEAEVTSSKVGLDSFLFAWEMSAFDLEFNNSTESTAVSEVLVKFKKDIVTASQKKEIYSKIDFLASCGSFLGLFCGFSILSFIEITYFLTLRLWTNLYRRCNVKAKPQNNTEESIHHIKDWKDTAARNIVPASRFYIHELKHKINRIPFSITPNQTGMPYDGCWRR